MGRGERGQVEKKKKESWEGGWVGGVAFVVRRHANAFFFIFLKPTDLLRQRTQACQGQTPHCDDGCECADSH